MFSNLSGVEKHYQNLICFHNPSLFLRHKYLLQLFNQYTVTAYTDAADLISNLFHVFHFFQLPQHGIFFHQPGSVQQTTGTGSFFTTHDSIGLCFLFSNQNLVHDFLYISRQYDIADTKTSYFNTQYIRLYLLPVAV